MSGRTRGGRIVDIIEDVLQPFTDEKGIEIVDVEYVKEGRDRFLRVFIDKDPGVDLDDCELVSNFLSQELDKSDPIKDQYFLEVSSPGLERIIKKDKDFVRFSGSEVSVSLYRAIEGSRKLQGILIGLEGEDIVIQIDDRKLNLPKDSVSQVRLVYNFN